jgi:uridine phosphorylase
VSDSEPSPIVPPSAASAPRSAAPAYRQAIHLRPTAALAERVLLPGDPGRALALAQSLLVKPLMFNHHRGLWGYTGEAASDGEPLTIQSTGMGGPSAAIVLTELIALGARRAIRVGTCGALDERLGLGDLLIAREAICADGASRALVAGEHGPIGDSVGLRSAADPTLTEGLIAGTPSAHAGTIVSVDLFYDDRPTQHASDALAVEMEAATLFAVGAAESVPVACVLVVSDTFDARGTRTRIGGDPLLQAAETMGVLAIAALSA